ncbi:MAG: hypothetical protein C4537_07425 [Acholeplasma sp.]|jgi:hypothetical protein|nr:MAG: hypothetical protein C4537_07425 [Acholeplasma sp.]
MKKIILLLLSVINLFSYRIIQTHAAPSEASFQPIFSHEAGFYHEGFSLLITAEEGTTVYYTLDSSDPNELSTPYTDPIWIEESWIEATGEEIIIAPDDEGNIPDPTYPISMIRTTSLYWMSPKEDIFQATVVKAIAIDNFTGEKSEIITHTYFVHPLMSELYSFPIISLSTDINHLYSYEEGINIPGINYDQNIDEKGIQQAIQDRYGSLTHPGQNRTGNYFQTGDAWEKPVFVEYFTTDGNRPIAQHAGLRLHGGLSRKYTVKSYRLYADDRYDEEDMFNYPFFNDKNMSEYKRIILRNGGQTYQYTLMGDALAQSILKPLTLDIQYSSPIILFMNGEYFGIRNIRDRLDQYYLATHYDINPDEVTILTGHAFLDEGSLLDQAHYQRMYSFASTKDLSIQKNYQKMMTWMDMDNYIDYMIAELYFGNVDWPQNNISYWRKSGGYHPDAPYGHDGRWRWMIQDLDASFGASWGTTQATQNPFDRLLGDSWKTGRLLIELLENDQFKAQFVYRLTDLLSSVYDEERVVLMVEDMIELYRDEMPDHIARFGYPTSIETWESYSQRMVDFGSERPSYLKDYLETWLNLDETHNLSFSYQPEQGTLKINQQTDTDGSLVFEAYQGIPLTMTAIPNEGFHFTGWYVGDLLLSEQETIYFPPTESLSIRAQFAIGDRPDNEDSLPYLGLIISTSIITLGSISILTILVVKHKKH